MAHGSWSKTYLALSSPLPRTWLPLSLAASKAPCTLSVAVFTASLALWLPFSRAFSGSSPCKSTSQCNQRHQKVLGAWLSLPSVLNPQIWNPNAWIYKRELAYIPQQCCKRDKRIYERMQPFVCNLSILHIQRCQAQMRQDVRTVTTSTEIAKHWPH